MEQALINAFMKLTAKVGAGELVRNLIHEFDENGNPKSWTPGEMEKAVRSINSLVERFGPAEAALVARTLVRKFNLKADEVLPPQPDPIPDATGVKGLQ